MIEYPLIAFGCVSFSYIFFKLGVSYGRTLFTEDDVEFMNRMAEWFQNLKDVPDDDPVADYLKRLARKMDGKHL